MKQKNKYLAIILIIAICLINVSSNFNISKSTEATKSTEITNTTQFEFNSKNVLKWAAGEGSGVWTNLIDAPWEFFKPTEINSEKVDTKEGQIIALETRSAYNDKYQDAKDAALIKEVTYQGTDAFEISKNLAQKLSIDEKDIIVNYEIKMPALESVNIKGKETQKIVVENGAVKQTADEIKKIADLCIEYNGEVYTSRKYANIGLGETDADWDDWEDKDESNKMELNFTFLSATATLSDGTEYYLVVGANDEHKNNWYLVSSDYLENKTPEFKTTLNYIAIIEGKDVGGTRGTTQNKPFYPNYDEQNIEKDADVTAIITSTTGNDIVEVNGEKLSDTAKTPNNGGWYYIDINNKKEIAKDYKFDDYDNTTYYGIVPEENVKLTSADGLTDTQVVSIIWPFRIIKQTQDPEKIDENTTQVRVEITTNLPMDPDQLPPGGWAFTDDEEGQTQHRIYRIFEKVDGDFDEEIVVKADGRSDTDTTTNPIKWKEKLPTEHVKAGENKYFIILGIVAIVVVLSIIRYRKSKLK